MNKSSDRFNNFGFSLIQSLQSPQQPNMLISPASVEIALGMVYAGATEQTADAISQTLGLNKNSREGALEDLADLQSTLVKPQEGVTLKLANGVWIDESIILQEQFSSDLAKTFKTTFESLRFSDPKTLARINDWVSRETEGKISDLLEAPPSPPMFLADAIYFHASWSNPFEKQANREQPFHLADGSSSRVNMMRQTGFFRYAKAPGYEVVALPYVHKRFGMYCFLPDQNVDSVIPQLRKASWSELSSALRPVQGSVSLPKFRVKYGVILNKALSKLGMGIAFDGSRAQFGRMINAPNRLFIGSVIHKTYLEVDEEGSTAAAATGVQMRATAIMQPGNGFDLVFDRPFLVAIADDESGTILFLGIIGDPKE
ncbi:MAG: serpin family protein [Verrucomicrobia bacterium]|nr:serpin family protein [Verrucomicrobiota bacterium]MBV9673484.1 serpin family protein [Verrucomicrobiota bacterium]